ncbi:flagellar hook-associated protein FlgK [Shumkonia mesophila]|uniref:flagellar hook-associated protein FlgK n=1 Tax=Shumkonia mesophila TaxID=2838854 RepID=UPI002934FC7E|nr:flagellar hook-associated protein FlgK [Shumkonia mesophila]
MDLRAAQYAALTGLTVAEAQSSVATTNVANAGVTGYTAKTTSLTTTVTGSSATGVSLSSITSYVNENLVRSLVAATSDQTYTQTVADYLEALSSALGTTDSETTIADRLTALQTAIADLAVTPESDSLKYLVVEAAVDVADSLNALSAEVQQQRADADQQIEDTVGELNTALAEIDELNEQITMAKALGQDTGDLEDARRVALQTVAEKLDVNYFTTSSGELHVYTQSGEPLVDSQAHTLAYEAAGNVSATMEYPSGFDEITLDGQAVTTKLSGGEIGALLELRDETLPAIQDELDALAATLVEEVNAVTNQGTAVPAAGTLTGTTSRASADSLSGTGTMRIALVDSDGVVDTVVDLDLSTYSTVGDLVSAIDAIDGVSASLDAEGRLVVSSDDSSLGVAINEMDSAAGTAGTGISSYFGLNSLFTGTSADTIRVRSDLAADSTLLATGTLSSDSTLAAGDTGIASGDGSIAEALEDLFGQSVDFAAAGSLGDTSATLADYASSIVSDVATKASTATSEAETADLVAENLSTSLSNESGVNLDEETARLAALENQYAACSQMFEIISEMFETLLDAVS